MPEERLRRTSREMFFAAFGPLSDADDWLVERITGAIDERRVRAGEPIYTEGEAPSWVHFMRDGRIRMSRKDGPSWTLAGRWVVGGYEAVLEVPRATTAVAEADMELMRIPTSSWLDIFEDSFELTRANITLSAKSLADLDSRLAVSPRTAREEPRVRRATSLVEKLAFMLDVRMLRGAGVQALADVAGGTEEDTFEAGEVVLERGADRDRWFFVVDGQVRAERASPDVVRTYGYGQLVCGPASFGPWSAPWRAVATVPTRTLSLPIETAFDAMEEHFDLARSLMGALATLRQLVIEQLAREVKGLVLT
jgi:CRP-like cAMP-binding protein